MFPDFPLSLAIPCLLLLGATFIMFIYHLLLYLQYREKIILKYCFYLLSISLYLLADINSRVGGLSTHITTKVLLADSFNFIVILVYASFIIEAIPGSKKRYKRLYTIWRVASGITVLYILFCFAICIPGPEQFEALINILNNVFRVVFVIIGVVATIILFPLMNERFLSWIKWGAITYLFFMGLVMVTVLATADRQLVGLTTMHYVYLGTLSEVIIFSIAMSYKIKELFLKIVEVRNRLSRDLHDEIGATLSGVILMSELVKKKLDTGSTAGIDNYIDRISTESKQMSEKMSDIVWAANPENDTLDKVIFKIQSYASGICSAKNIVLHFTRPPIGNDVALNVTARNNLYLISKEAINNAVKYSGAGNIWFIFQQKGKHYYVAIKDDGRGFEPGETITGNGLKNMKVRAGEMNASFMMQAVKGTGTTIELTFT